MREKPDRDGYQEELSMAWGTVYLLKLDSDAIVTQASDKYASWYSLGPHQKHAINGGGSYTQLMSRSL